MQSRPVSLIILLFFLFFFIFVAAPNEQSPLLNNGRGTGSVRDMSPGGTMDALVALGHAI